MIAKFGCLAVVIVYMVFSNADPLSLREKHSGTKLENTSMPCMQGIGAGVFPESAFGRYHAHNSETAENFAII